MKPLLKTEYKNLPLSIPQPWLEFFGDTAQTLGCSRNSAMCMALKFGGPLLGKYVEMMREELKDQCSRIDKLRTSEILGSPGPLYTYGKPPVHERRNKTARKRPGKGS